MMQKKALGLISKIGNREHTNKYFKAMNILKLDDLFKIKICSYLYKTLYCNYDDQLKNKITIQSNIHSHNTRNKRHFSIKRFNRSKSPCHILYRGIKIFNSTPQLLYNNKSLKVIRNELYQFYCDQY